MKHPYWMVLRRCQSPLNHGFWGMSNIRGKGFTHAHTYYIYIYIYTYVLLEYIYIYTFISYIVGSWTIHSTPWGSIESPKKFFMEEMSTTSGRGRWQHRLLQCFWRHLLRRLQLFGILHGWSRALRRPLGGTIYGKTKGAWWKTNGTSRWHGKFDGKDWEKTGEVQLRIKAWPSLLWSRWQVEAYAPPALPLRWQCCLSVSTRSWATNSPWFMGTKRKVTGGFNKSDKLS